MTLLKQLEKEKEKSPQNHQNNKSMPKCSWLHLQLTWQQFAKWNAMSSIFQMTASYWLYQMAFKKLR